MTNKFTLNFSVVKGTYTYIVLLTISQFVITSRLQKLTTDVYQSNEIVKILVGLCTCLNYDTYVKAA